MSVIYGWATEQWNQMRRDYQDVLEAQYAAAVHATHGYMVNARGLAAGHNSLSVFTGSQQIIGAYGTRELKDWLWNHPRTTLAAFEAGWFNPEEQP